MENVEYRGYTIEIESDNDPLNPRTDYDTGTVMVCQHGCYSLGDEKHGVDLGGCNNWADVKQAIIDQKSPIVILPLYLYDHSGITMNTTGFGCRFDSGQVGFIFVDEAKCDMIGWTKEYIATLTNGDNPKYKGKEREEILTDFMISDVETYDNYISGQVYRFEIDGIEDEYSCGGFFGYDHEKSGLLSEARSSIDAEISYKIKKKIEKLKELIKAKVPVIYRVLPSL